jgi:hypothetical protein
MRSSRRLELPAVSPLHGGSAIHPIPGLKPLGKRFDDAPASPALEI